MNDMNIFERAMFKKNVPTCDGCPQNNCFDTMHGSQECIDNLRGYEQRMRNLTNKRKKIAIIFGIIAAAFLGFTIGEVTYRSCGYRRMPVAIFEEFKEREANINKSVRSINAKLEDVHGKMEHAYFDGQQDYMNGVIRIEKNDSSYHWIMSPWGDDTIAISDLRYYPNKDPLNNHSGDTNE